jgi:hypothetical protein
MTQQVEKTLHSVCMTIGVFLTAMLVAVVATALHKNPNAWIDLLPKAWLSDKDKNVLKDPEAANKAEYEKIGREAWEHSQAQQPGGGWNRNLNK